jgi:hypothetical protein
MKSAKPASRLVRCCARPLVLAAAMMIASETPSWPDPWAWSWSVAGGRLFMLACLWVMVWASFDHQGAGA